MATINLVAEAIHYIIGAIIGSVLTFIFLIKGVFETKKFAAFRLMLDEVSFKVVEKAVLNDDRSDLLQVSYTLPMADAKRLYKRDSAVINACLEFGCDKVYRGNSVYTYTKNINDYSSLINKVNG